MKAAALPAASPSRFAEGVPSWTGKQRASFAPARARTHRQSRGWNPVRSEASEERSGSAFPQLAATSWSSWTDVRSTYTSMDSAQGLRQSLAGSGYDWSAPAEASAGHAFSASRQTQPGGGRGGSSRVVTAYPSSTGHGAGAVPPTNGWNRPRQAAVDALVPDQSSSGVDEVWLRVRLEAREGAESEPFLASYMYSAILAHPSMEGALAFHLSNKLADNTLLSTQLKELFIQVLTSDIRIQDAIRADLVALEARDPACLGFAHGMLNFKGYLALQTHRVAHRLWTQGRECLALALANRVSEVFHVEIHPAARLGKGLLLDHATGVVIGETASVGDNVSILHHVTLGGTGCSGGLRHPQVESGVLIGAGAKLLGPISVGAGAKIGAGTVVLQDVPPHATVVGNPGRIRPEKGTANPNAPSPSETMDHADFVDWVI